MWYRGIVLVYLVDPAALAVHLDASARPELMYEQGVVLVQGLYQPSPGADLTVPNLTADCMVAAQTQVAGVTGLSILRHATTSFVGHLAGRLAAIPCDRADVHVEDDDVHFVYEAAGRDGTAFMRVDLVKECAPTDTEGSGLTGLLPERLETLLFSRRCFAGWTPAIRLRLTFGECLPLTTRSVDLAPSILNGMVAGDELQDPVAAVYCGSLEMRYGGIAFVQSRVTR